MPSLVVVLSSAIWCRACPPCHAPRWPIGEAPSCTWADTAAPRIHCRLLRASQPRATRWRWRLSAPCQAGRLLLWCKAAVEQARSKTPHAASGRSKTPLAAARPRSRARPASLPSTTTAGALSEGVVPGQQNGARKPPGKLEFSVPSASSTIAPVAARRPSKLADRPRCDARHAPIDTIIKLFWGGSRLGTRHIRSGTRCGGRR